jgi:hypothetical protein
VSQINCWNNKRNALGCLSVGVLLTCSLSLGTAAVVNEPIDWCKIRTSFKAFVDDPSPANGRIFVDALPKRPSRNPNEIEFKERLKTLDLIVNPIGHSAFRKITIDGNRYAFEAVFRLLNISDAAYSEMLLSLLGEIVRIHPRKFLDVLYEYRDMEAFVADGFPVTWTKYDPRSKEEENELRMRIEALDSVSDEKYREVRDICVSEIQKALIRLKRQSSSGIYLKVLSR